MPNKLCMLFVGLLRVNFEATLLFNFKLGFIFFLFVDFRMVLGYWDQRGNCVRFQYRKLQEI